MRDLEMPVFIPTMDITEKKQFTILQDKLRMRNVIWIDQ